MELDGDVDVSEFPASELRRQQMQSYIIKVLLPGTEDAVKIQHYHRYATCRPRERQEPDPKAQAEEEKKMRVRVLLPLLPPALIPYPMHSRPSQRLLIA